jgi:hypothetical protein
MPTENIILCAFAIIAGLVMLHPLVWRQAERDMIGMKFLMIAWPWKTKDERTRGTIRIFRVLFPVWFIFIGVLIAIEGLTD